MFQIHTFTCGLGEQAGTEEGAEPFTQMRILALLGADYAALPASYKVSVFLFLEPFSYQLHRKRRGLGDFKQILYK